MEEVRGSDRSIKTAKGKKKKKTEKRRKEQLGRAAKRTCSARRDLSFGWCKLRRCYSYDISV